MRISPSGTSFSKAQGQTYAVAVTSTPCCKSNIMVMRDYLRSQTERVFKRSKAATASFTLQRSSLNPAMMPSQCPSLRGAAPPCTVLPSLALAAVGEPNAALRCTGLGVGDSQVNWAATSLGGRYSLIFYFKPWPKRRLLTMPSFCCCISRVVLSSTASRRHVSSGSSLFGP